MHSFWRLVVMMSQRGCHIEKTRGEGCLGLRRVERKDVAADFGTKKGLFINSFCLLSIPGSM